MEITCTFETLDDQYMCCVQKAVITQKCGVKSFKGKHTPGKSNGDVEFLSFEDSIVHYLPSGLYNFFPNLEELEVQNCGLKEITSEELFGLENLKSLWLYENKLTSLPDNLFVHTKKITRFSVRENRLRNLSSRLFSPIPDNQWSLMSFKSNPRVDAMYWPGKEESLKSVLELKLSLIHCALLLAQFPTCHQRNSKCFGRSSRFLI